MTIEAFERATTVQFTFTSSVNPDAAPTFKVTGIAQTVVASVTATSSDSTHYYALYTTPTSDGIYMGEWFAQKTVLGSAYNFITRHLFQVKPTQQI